MNKIALQLFMGLIVLIISSCERTNDSFHLKYETYQNDPTGCRIYTLDNGLKVYLSVNKDEPRILANIGVKAGSKYDPADCTGLAHYLEHMLFKGNSKFGTINWEKEKIVLDQISALFEQHKNSSDSLEKINIYKAIDSLSLIASQYTVPNEFDKMTTSLGASKTNAYTSNERTVYTNEIPSNELEKWLKLEASRFSELVLRLFHTELETVYEEFNRGQDNDFGLLFKKMYSNLYPSHQYGTQTTIGKGEHLKNPSMVKIHEYFNKYYVPNNMCIILSGDLDYDETIKLIDKYFGEFKAKKVPSYSPPVEKEIENPIQDSLFGPREEAIAIAYRFPGVKDKEIKTLEIIDEILNNGKAGLIDLNIIQKQKVLNAGSGINKALDYSTFYMYGLPKDGQSLDEVAKLLFSQIEIIKNGEFDDWLIEAIINNRALREKRALEGNLPRINMMLNSFIFDIPWNEMITQNDALKSITKDDVISFAKKYFNDNYVQIKKLKGSNVERHKVNKPNITPISINRDTSSIFQMAFDSMKSEEIQPLFIDFNKSLNQGQLPNEMTYSYVQNEINDLFELSYLMDYGTDNNKLLGLALSYLPYLGTSKYSNEELQKEWFKNGLSFSASSSRDKVYVSLSGIKGSFEEGLQLLEHVMEDIVKNDTALIELKNDIIKRRANAKLNKGQILFSGLLSFAKYGEKSPFTNSLDLEELMAVQSDTLIALIKDIFKNEHRVFLYSNNKKDLDLVSDKHTYKPRGIQIEDMVDYIELDQTKNSVLFTHYDMVQTEIILLSKDKKGFDLETLPEAYIFNEYFGSGLSSIVFQEIRESKALAYSSYCSYSFPKKKEDSNYVLAYLGTQTDKLGDAVAALLELMNDMPQAEAQFEQAKSSAMKSIASNRITKSSIFWNYEGLKKLGIDYDYREKIYNEIEEMTLSDLNTFFNNHIKGKQYTYAVIGDRDKVDFEALKKLGTVRELSLEEVFGY